MQRVNFTATNLVECAIEGPRGLALETKSRAKNPARLSDEGEGYLKFGRHPQFCLADDGMNEEIFKELAEVKSGFIDFESRCEKLKKSHEELRESNRALSKVLEGVSFLEVALSRLMY